MDLLLPIFENDKILLKHAFDVLKKKKYVDEYALITSTGFALVEELKGKGEGTIGKDLTSSFKQIAKSWSRTNSFKATESMNKVAWKFDISSIIGHVSTEHLWKFLPIEDLKSMKIENIGTGASHLKMDTNNDVSVTLESVEDSITFALFDVLDQDKSDIFRLVCAIFLGIKDKKDLAYVTGIESFAISSKLEHMIRIELVDNDLSLMPKAFKMIKEHLTQNLVDTAQTDILESARLREMEMDYVKKKMMDKLM
ncbi:MAG: hypothetical protein R2741_02765 [Methanolobus sp.]